MPGEVETRGSTQYVGKPLPQCKLSASKQDATSEKMEKLGPKKNVCEILKRFLVKFFVRC